MISCSQDVGRIESRSQSSDEGVSSEVFESSETQLSDDSELSQSESVSSEGQRSSSLKDTQYSSSGDSLIGSSDSKNESSVSAGSSTVLHSSGESISSGQSSSSVYLESTVEPGMFFIYPEPKKVTISIDPQEVDFHRVLNEGFYAFPEGFSWSDAEIDALNDWARNLAAGSPFKGYAQGELPWIDIQGGAALVEKGYVFITQEQLAYIYLVELFGGVTAYHGDQFTVGGGSNMITVPEGGAFETGLNYTFNYRNESEHDKNFLMLSVMSFLMEIMKNDSYKLTYVGVAQGGFTGSEGMDALNALDMSSRQMGGLNVCNFDASGIVIESGRVMQPEWCRAEVSPSDMGGSFHAIDIPGQTAVNIAGHNFGGGSACPGCHLSGPQDECMPNFYAETIGFNFFMPKNPEGMIPASIYSVKALTFFGVRRYLDGLNGSNTYTGTCGNPTGPAQGMMEQKTQVTIADETFDMYHHSMTFVASQMNGANDNSNWWKAERKYCTVGDVCDITSPPQMTDVGKWYGAFAPEAYNPSIDGLMRKMINRIGSFNWGAGVWWGDAEQYFFIIWLGSSMLDNITLDYYIMANSCENAGVQCGMLSGSACNDCYDKSNSPIDFGDNCPTRGVVEVYPGLASQTVQNVYTKLIGASNTPYHVVDGM